VYALDPVSTGFSAMKAAQKAGKPFVVKIVGDYAWEQGRQRFGITQNLDEFVKEKSVPFLVRVLRRIQTHVAQNATRIIVPSEYLKGIVAAWGISPEKIEVIYNAVPVEKLGTVPSSVEHLSRPLVIGSLGRLVPWKGIDGVIDAVAELRNKRSQTSLVIAGDGPERIPLVAHAEQKLKGGYVFTGSLAHSDGLALLKYADVFVLNSTYEGLSHLLIEAFGLGIPIIATSAGGNPEVITDGKNGLLVPPGDTPALVGALDRLLSDEELRARLSASAKKSAERFSIKTMLASTERCIKNI